MSGSESNSTSSTPMFLTPESTGSPELLLQSSPSSSPSGAGHDSGSSGSANLKKARRQTAFYPNMNASNKPQKPFSRSAAKRESVMTLGSIEHLQHYFTKTGIAAKNNPLNKPHSGLVPAIGGPSHIHNPPFPTSTSTPSPPFPSPPVPFELPPSPPLPPAPGPHPAFPPYVKTFDMDPESLLPGVVDDLREVARAWAIDVDDPTAGDAHAHDPERLSVNPNPNSTATAKKKPPQPTSTFEVLSVLKSTTRAIRSIRNYVLSLPDDSAGSIRSQFRSNLLNPVPKKPPPTTTTTTSTTTSTSTSAAVSAHHPAPADPLTLIRRSALEVLTCLRELEEKSRVPLEDDAYDAQSDHGSSTSQARSTIASPSGRSHSSHSTDPTDPDADPDADAYPADTAISYSYIQVQGRSQSVPVWEDDASSDSDEEKLEKRSHWDERLVLGSGWLYRQDVRLADLSVERGVVGRYLGVVDDVLFGGREGGKRGWEREGERVERRKGGDRDGRKGRRVSEGGAFQFPGPRAGRGARRVASNEGIRLVDGASLSEEPGAMMDTLSESGEESESVDDDELPEWAKRSAFPSDPLGRTHALLHALLPPSSPLLHALPPPTHRTTFLHALSSGQHLCAAYNTGVRWSRKPWGYISKDAVHDIVALEQAAAAATTGDEKGETGKRGWTFRRTDNLRLWAAALKLRYLLPVVAPPAPVQSRASPGIPAPAAPGSSLTTSTTAATSPSFLARSSEPPIFFDAPLVARKEDGWEDMLENTVLRWMDAVVEERRGAR